ncbi:MAG: hypothetical protein KGM42_01395 [Hyphomicrobiales bacterium]|nr:hypothetical protein [Hyphomicrobiales bacterium]
MRRLIAALVLAAVLVPAAAEAQGRHLGWGRGHHYGWSHGHHRGWGHSHHRH